MEKIIRIFTTKHGHGFCTTMHATEFGAVCPSVKKSFAITDNFTNKANHLINQLVSVSRIDSNVHASSQNFHVKHYSYHTQYQSITSLEIKIFCAEN